MKTLKTQLPPLLIDVGSPLPGPVQARMETVFNADFSHVRIHIGPEPMFFGAIAYTCGADIYFAPGAYDPWNQPGQELLGHELAHVLQQRAGRVPGGSGQSMVLNNDPALEAEAEIAGRKAAQGESVGIPGAWQVTGDPARSSMVIQCCDLVVPGARAGYGGGVAGGIVINNPSWRAAAAPPPTAIANDTFIGQDKGGAHAQSASSFLQASGAVNVSSADPAGVTLRVSTSGNMAIENVDLNQRQPKVFYATAGIVDESNDRLALLGSHFQLIIDLTQTITVNGQTLYRVMPQNTTNNTQELDMTTAQQCDTLIGSVIGSQQRIERFNQNLVFTPHRVLPEYHIAKALLPTGHGLTDIDDTNNNTRGATIRAITIAYSAAARAGGIAFTNNLQQYGINQYVVPEAGEGFVTTGLIGVPNGAGFGAGALPAVVEDYFHLAADGVTPQILNRGDTWGSHWGGVVAKDGRDIVTLENYARNVEDALAGTDKRYYFQMYDTDPASNESWHNSWSSVPTAAVLPAPLVVGQATYRPLSPGSKVFANPLTMRITVLDAHYDTIAQRLYANDNTGIQNHYNQVATAADAHDEILQTLKGLHYANLHLNANRAGNATRVLGWQQALATTYGNARFRQNKQVLYYAHGKIMGVRSR